ncbi:MAG: hypothetical protein H6739_12005 [Alphaproteobacteria bacterium]|nr:hypothetical protein [Alphaproteobacteria bacterium]
MNLDVHELVKKRRFMEALYFGSADGAPTPADRFALGVACIIVVKAIANRERARAGVDVRVSAGSVGRSTTMVREGLKHIVQALRDDPTFRPAEGLKPIIVDALDDLKWYLRQEFHGFSALYEVGLAADLLLATVSNQPDTLPPGSTNVERASRVLRDMLGDLWDRISTQPERAP